MSRETIVYNQHLRLTNDKDHRMTSIIAELRAAFKVHANFGKYRQLSGFRRVSTYFGKDCSLSSLLSLLGVTSGSGVTDSPVVMQLFRSRYSDVGPSICK